MPDTIEHEGALYRRSRWRRSYPGVVEQYREAVPRDSRHLFVMEDGSRVVAHVDRFNPDMGSPLSHFLADHPLGRAVVVVLGLRALAGGA